MTDETGEKTYEMQWDCAYCGATKLLGVTHRYCPECGAAQDPDKRYFPPDDEKVALEDHRYVGADRLCPYCNEAQSAAAKHCTACGGDFEGAKQAKVQGEQVVAADGKIVAAGAAPPAPAAGSVQASKPAGSSRLVIAIGIVAVLVVGFLVVNTLWTKDATVEVVSRSWTRSIAIESYREFEDKAACNKVPGGAKILSRKKGKKVCKKRRIDQGDGSFKEKKECTKPKEICTYRKLAWKKVRSEKASGGKGDQPRWPDAKLRKRGQCKGCEREGKKTETYRVEFKDSTSGKLHSCSFAFGKWKGFTEGKTYKAKLGGLSGGLRCGALQAN